MFFIRSSCFTILVTSIAALAGCSGGGASSASTGNSTCAAPGGLGSVSIDALTSAQRATVCSDFQSCATSVQSSVLTPLLQLTCRTIAVSFAALAGAPTDAALRQACQQFYDSCVGEDGGGLGAVTADAGSQGDQCNASLTQIAPGCTATVDQYVQCINDSDSATAAAVQAALQAVPACSAITLATVSGAADAGSAFTLQPLSPASCVTLQASCPLLSADGGSDAGP